MQKCVLRLIPLCAVIAPVCSRQPSDGVLYMLIFTCLSASGILLALFFVMQWPGIVQRADETLRPQAGLGRSGFVELVAP